MKWYYSKKGNVGKRGQAEFDVLRAMAADGRLVPEDIVCNETNPRWIPAGEVEGLFPAPSRKGRDKRRKSAAARDERRQESDDQPARQHTINAMHLRELVLAIFCVAVFAIWQIKPHIPGLTPPPPAPFATPPSVTIPLVAPPDSPAAQEQTTAAVQSELLAVAVEPAAPQVVMSEEDKAWFALCERFEANMKNADGAGASRTLERMIQDYGANEVTTHYRDRLTAMRRTMQELDELKVRLLGGVLDQAEAVRLTELSAHYDRPGYLRDLMQDTLSDTTNPNAAKCVAVLRTAVILLDVDTARKAAAQYANRLGADETETNCLQVVALCTRIAMADSGDAILCAFLALNPKSSAAWLESAAIKADSGRSDDAIKALQKAVKFGGKPERLAAQADKRFDSIRDTRAFRKCVR